MRVSGYNTFYHNNNIKPTFTEYRDFVMNNNGRLDYRMDTCSFRHDIDFDRFAKFLGDKFPNLSDVEFVVHACSDGEEAYTYASAFDCVLGDRAKPLYPLTAKDLNPKCVELANNAVYKMKSYELDHAKFQLSGKVDDYYKLLEKGNCYELRTPSDKIKHLVKFAQGNIFNDIDNLKGHKTVLSARNFWQYLKSEDAILLAYKIAKKFDSTCMLVIGHCDKDAGIGEILTELHFREVPELNNVFVKTSDSLPSPGKLHLTYSARKLLQDFEYLHMSKFSKFMYNLAKFVI